MLSQQDKSIVRELAKKYMEQVCSEKQERMLKRMRDMNDLKQGRPPVILAEIPWYQMDMDGELSLLCESERARKTELHFRMSLYYLKHFKADNLFEPFFRVKRAVDSTGIGIEFKASDIKRTDSINNIVSREYEDVLKDESALELMHDPVFTLRPDKDAENMEFYTDLLGDSIPINLYGFGYYYSAPWDKITRLRGVEPILMDMYDRPEYLHAIMDKFISAAIAELDFAEKHLDVDKGVLNMHCTPAVISGKGENGLKRTWYRGMAQSLGVVSPKMFEELELSHAFDEVPTVIMPYSILTARQLTEQQINIEGTVVVRVDGVRDEMPETELFAEEGLENEANGKGRQRISSRHNLAKYMRELESIVNEEKTLRNFDLQDK